MAGFNYFTRWAVPDSARNDEGQGDILACVMHLSTSFTFRHSVPESAEVGLPFVNGNDPNLKFLLMIPSG